MPFLEDARDFLRQELAATQSRFVDGYVHRVLAREGADLREAVVRRRLRLAVGDDDLVGDTELGRRPHLLLVGNAGSGKSFVAAFTYSRAADTLLVDPSAPFPILLDYAHQGFFGSPAMNRTAAMNVSRRQGSWRLPVFSHKSSCSA
jgi:hypothetical protein